MASEQIICVNCKANLPILDHQSNIENYREKFVDIDPQHVFCFLQFRKDNISQKLLHEFKYNGFKNIGRTLGFWFGEYMKDSCSSTTFDCILPIPLHKKKQKKRGFNQSEIISQGISKSLGIPVDSTIIERVYENKTQTVKSRSDRMFSVKGLFRVNKPEVVEKKKVLLVDDVITTGSTLASCASELLNCKVSGINLAALTMAK